MLKSFQRKLTLLYTLTTGIILSFALLATLAYSERLMYIRNDHAFLSCIWTLTTAIQSQRTLSHAWLAQMEAENHMIIHIEENQTPLLYKGSWEPPTDRDTLIAKAKAMAAAGNIAISDALLLPDIRQSDISEFQGNYNDFYKCVVLKLPADNHSVDLILLYSMSPLKNTIRKQRCLFALIDVAGIFALFVVCYIFSKKSLYPIRENKEKQEAFFAAASHELRSPVAVIQACANAMNVNPAKSAAMISNILSECRRLTRLTDDMLALSMTAKTEWDVTLSPIDTDTLLLDTFETYEPICAQRGLKLSLNLPDTALPHIMGDNERLRQLLGILLDNAISHSLPSSAGEGRIELSARTRGHRVEILVADHGVGIPDDEKKRVFDHFYRGDRSRGDKNHFGLGLGIARELAKLHHGQLDVCDTEGGGATFRVTMPCKTFTPT